MKILNKILPIAFTLISVITIFSISLQAQTWQFLGSQYSVNEASDISIGYSGGVRTLYVAAQHDVLLYSNGNPIAWSKSTFPVPIFVSCVPSNPSTVYAGNDASHTTSYLEESTNGGGTWTPIIFGLGGSALNVTRLSISLTNSSFLYLGTQASIGELISQPATSLKPSLLYVSTNGGSSWVSIPTTVFPPNSGTITRIVFDPTNSSSAYVSVSTSGPGACGVYPTTDGGNSFKQENKGMGSDSIGVSAIDVSSQISGTVFAGTNPGSGYTAQIYKSTNGGVSWTGVYTFTGGGNVKDIKIDQNSSPLTIYAATSNGVLKSTNGGSSWFFTNTTLGDLDVRSITVDPTTSNLVYIGTSVKFYMSSDGGVTWQDAGVDNVTAGGIAIYNDDIYMFNGANNAQVASKLLSGSSTWDVIPTPYIGSLAARDAAIDPSNPAYIYAVGNVPTAFYREIISSTNNGVSWQTKYDAVASSTLGYNSVAIDPNATNNVYAVSEWNEEPTWVSELATSTDHGQDWSYPISNAPASADYYSFAIDRTSGSPSATMYIGGADYLYNNQRVSGRILARTTNGGTLWTYPYGDGYSSLLYFTSVFVESDTIYAAYSGRGTSEYGGIIKSTNGTTFNNLTLPTTNTMHHVICLLRHPNNLNMFWMAEEADPGVWKVSVTIDGGATWTNLSGNLPSNVKIHHLAFKSNCGTYETPRYLYAATDNGVYKLDLNYTAAYTTTSNWNMLAVPDVVSDFRSSTVWQNETANPLWYNTSTQQYQSTSVLQNGLGYFVQFTSINYLNYIGWKIYNYQVPVLAGWNLIGGISNTIPTSAVVQNPSGIVVNNSFFEYINGGYTPVTTLSQGMAIWVQVTTNGTLTFPSSPPKISVQPTEIVDQDKFTVTDALGAEQSMVVGKKSSQLLSNNSVDDSSYQMPPDPPFGPIPASFTTGRYISTVSSAEGPTSIPIRVKSTHFPIKFGWDIKPENALMYTLSLSGSTEQKALQGKGVTTIDKLPDGIIHLNVNAGLSASTPKEFSLSQNYPNPFNPTTKIEYTLPTQEYVKLVVFNVLGQQVSTLVDQVQDAGYKSAEFDASALPSGIYFYKIQAGTFSKIAKMALVK